VPVFTSSPSTAVCLKALNAFVQRARCSKKRRWS